MDKLQFSVQIKAPKKKVWDTMLADKTYREWTTPFSPDGSSGGYYKGSWDKGSKILFLGAGPDGKTAGMVSRIAENKPHEFISIEHLGVVHDGVEDTTSAEAKEWAGAHENYTFKQTDGVTQVIVDLEGNISKEFSDMFAGMWPQALQKLKELAEK